MSKPHVLEFNNKNLYPKGPKLCSVTMVNIFLGLEVAFFNMNIKVVQEIRITFASCDEWFSCHLPFSFDCLQHSWITMTYHMKLWK